MNNPLFERLGIDEDTYESMAFNQPICVKLHGIRFKIYWLRLCTFRYIESANALFSLREITAKEHLARVAAAILLNHCLFLFLFYAVLWRVLSLATETERLRGFCYASIRRELKFNYFDNEYLSFRERMEFLRKRRYYILCFDEVQGYTAAQLFLISRKE